MPIPEPNTPWLPAPWDQAYRAYQENDAWFTGDTAQLEKLYARERQTDVTHQRRGTPMQGGLVGAASRMFWGRPVPPTENRSRIHVPAPADVAALASDLVFAEPPKISPDSKDTKTGSRLELIAGSEDAQATYNRMGELKSAFGAAVLVTRWDVEVEDHAWLDVVAADVVIPTFRSGRLTEITMWTEYQDGQAFYRHLEHHSKGFIEHALFLGTQNNLGRRVPLTERAETSPYADMVNADSVIETGIDRLTASYNPNMPTVAWRKKGVLADTGRSDFAQLHPLFDWLDETVSAWVREIRLGAGRILVPETFLETNGVGTGGFFDMGREVFAGLNMPGDPTKVAIDKVQFDIRVDPLEATARWIYTEIMKKAGFSPSSWGEYTGGAMTATEVSDRKSASERTRDKKILRDRAAIARQASVALEIDGKLFPGKGGTAVDVNVEFPDVSQESPLQLAQTINLLDQAGALSLAAKVSMWNPDWDETRVKQEVVQILTERRVPDPTTFAG